MKLVACFSEYENLPVNVSHIGDLSRLNSGFAAVYESEHNLILIRDMIGRIPLYYSKGQQGYSFQEKPGYDLLPFDKVLVYDKKTGRFSMRKRSFFSCTASLKEPMSVIVSKLKQLVKVAIKERIVSDKLSVLFSGGVDSGIIAFMLKKFGVSVECVTACVHWQGPKLPEDLVYAERAADELGLKLKVVKCNLNETENALVELIKILRTRDVVTLGIALPIYFAMKQCSFKHVFTGIGAEEVFAGYLRHKQAKSINLECLRGLKGIEERDLSRDRSIALYFGKQLMMPFLDNRLVKYGLRIPGKLKIHENYTKYVLRLAAEQLGLPEFITFRKKRAAQYGSNFDKAIQKLARLNGYKKKRDYIQSLSTAT